MDTNITHPLDPDTRQPSAVEGTRGAVKAQAQHLADEARELGRLGKIAAKEEVQHARERGAEAVDGAVDHLKRYENSLSDAVRERPLRTLSYAAGAGILLGFLLRR